MACCGWQWKTALIVNIVLTVIFASAVVAFIHLHANLPALLGWVMAFASALIRTICLYKAKPLPDGLWPDDTHRSAWLTVLAISPSTELLLSLVCGLIGLGLLGVSIAWLSIGIVHNDPPSVDSHWPSAVSIFTASRNWLYFALDWKRARALHLSMPYADEESPLIHTR
eukprot:TRINITY_DN7831_c0_g1_i1.p1 TRINITY_DN7831_c0_g1~~TRINITY_DN7831_c0_g1_i1.p1  ORF type:complete len:169 (+),score=7.94 TRINITY_DN7831_c0_g1_i1:186-692(+)